ncbi:MAG TPA: porphobilinogen synthase, partial [Vampirovibrionales bacterium]
HRPRRLRQTNTIRNLVTEHRLHLPDLVYPLFVKDTQFPTQEEIASMPGCYRFNQAELIKEVAECYELGLRTFALFPVISENLKTPKAEEAFNENGLIVNCIKVLKQKLPDICLIADVALDPYTDHGHDGIVDEQGEILNDETIEALKKMALVQANAGVDIVAPSDMMDGRIAQIRKALDDNHFSKTLILSYSAKYASAFYGPFRDAVHSNPKFGDKKTYQLNPANIKEAEKELLLDMQEGADMLMVKPGLAYLDVIKKAAEISHLPIVAYSVSGEYCMVKAAAQQGWLDEKKVVLESLLAFKRAGANAIFTYYAKQVAGWLKEGAN